jgi:hypothetical protein
MRSLKQLVVVASFAVLACAGLRAQSVDLRATIPFDFRAGDKLMPAGEYVVQGLNPWIILRQQGGDKAASALMTNAASRGNSTGDSRLVFNRYGDTYFLTAIWNQSTEYGRQVPETALQRELAKAGDVPIQAAVALASSK